MQMVRYDIDGEVIELFVIRTSRGGKAPLTGEVITDARQDLDQMQDLHFYADEFNGAKEWRRLTFRILEESSYSS